MPEAGAILITRPEPGASATAAHLLGRGFIPVLAPLLRIRRLQPRLPGPDRIQALVVTSANALPALAVAHRQVPLYVVGDATAAEARALGFTVVTSAGGDATALSALVDSACQPKREPLLLATGARQGGRLAAALRVGRFAVIRRSVYAAEPVAKLPKSARTSLAEGRIAAALFFSGETAATFTRLVAIAGLSAALTPVAAMVIGPAAARALRPLPFRSVRVALRPTEEAVLAMLE
ncbi:MAG: uroporphyrinogen-III synthase [Acetobacteraceae bacterium]